MLYVAHKQFPSRSCTFAVADGIVPPATAASAVAPAIELIDP